MTKKSSQLENILCGILFCISVTALVISCLAFTKKNKWYFFHSATPNGNMHHAVV